MYERTCTEKDTSIIRMEDITEEYNLDFEDIWHCLKVAKELERYDVYLKQSTTDFEDVVNITVDSSRVILQNKQSGNKNNKNKDRQVVSCVDDGINKSKYKKLR